MQRIVQSFVPNFVGTEFDTKELLECGSKQHELVVLTKNQLFDLLYGEKISISKYIANLSDKIAGCSSHEGVMEVIRDYMAYIALKDHVYNESACEQAAETANKDQYVQAG